LQRVVDARAASIAELERHDRARELIRHLAQPLALVLDELVLGQRLRQREAEEVQRALAAGLLPPQRTGAARAAKGLDEALW